ncbi:MAG: TetR/AcrR family transcriptional regulator, partial [bacterium]|nr:TetR/AcrR family transcriptional regulator [bacterium]
ALYNYFPSKDEIVDVILSEVTARSPETFRRPLGDGEAFRAYLVSLIADLLRLAEEDRSVLSLVLSLGEAAGRTGELIESHAARLTHRLGELLSSGMEQGALRLTSPETAARFVQAVVRASLLMRQDNGRQPRREVLVEELGEFVFHGLSARR